VCLDKVQTEVGDALTIEWRSYLLRPYPEPKPLEAFRRYTKSWMRPAGQEDAGEFRVWQSDAEPPSHSIPPNVAVKAAAAQNAFGPYHMALMHAYFWENRNVTARSTIVEVAKSCGLDVASFERDLDNPALTQAVMDDHHEAMKRAISGVPAVIVNDVFQIPGSQEKAVYLQLVQKARERGLGQET